MDGGAPETAGDRSHRFAIDVPTTTKRFSFEQSIRRSGPSLGVGPESGVLGRQSDVRHDEDDEEALKWAALERLPTYNRLRTTIWKNVSESGRRTFIQEVDVRKLGLEERNQLIDKLLKIPHDDNEAFLQKLRARLDKVGIRVPNTQVRYEHLSVTGKTSIAGRHLPTLPNTVLNILEAGLEKVGISVSKKAALTILNDVSGIVKPSRMTLLLGPPGSGKTTLLLALAGRLSPDLKVKGRITYNGYDLSEFVPQKTSAYIGQNDLHMPELTVRETLDFSARCQGVGTRYEMLSELIQREKEAGILPEPDIDLYMKATSMTGVKSSLATDYTLKILGLDICADIPVGDNMQRGISGGQRKRLTTGEMIVGPTKTLFMDEISTGLDSSTTFQIVKCLRQFVHVLEGTILMSLLQPAPETYELFDNIILLSEGQIVYQGPKESVLPFFEECGFRCPERKGVADFLQEVTSTKDQEQYWFDKQRPYEYVTVKQFTEKFKEFHVGVQLATELASSYNKSEGHPAALVFHKFSLSTWEMLKANWEKELLLFKRNSFVYVFKSVQVGILALVAGTVFVYNRLQTRTPADGQFALLGLFFGVLVILFNGFAELSFTLVRLPVFFKQRDILLYPAWAYAIPSIVLKIPVSLLESFLFTVITYFLIGYTPEASRFFKQAFVFFLEHVMATSLYRAIATLSRSFVIANTGGSMSLLLVVVLGGFIVPRPKVPSYWIWAYWSSPLSYVQTAVSVNELLAPRWMRPFTLDSGETKPLGVYSLETRGLFSESYWYGISVGALIGFIILLNVVYVLGLTFLNPLNKPQAIISKEQLAQKIVEENGQTIDHLQNKESKISPINGAGAGAGNHSKRSVQMTASNRSSLDSIAGDAALEAAEGLAPKRGMILPFTPLTISFENISYSVHMPPAMKAQGVREDRLRLLHSVSGAVRPGVLTALVGVSGAGKTTLMDVLAGRKTGGYVEGDIRISGFPKVQETFARISGYCEQFDIHSPQVTVYESLVYSAWLRLSPDIAAHTRKEFVEEVMELVELSPLRDGLVGLPGVSGLSTEQRKRLTIAVELVANPSIIFMDEPTSGLDARAAAIVMRTVRNTVDTGRTVVCTIHQPSIDIFESFDELMLLKRGGQLIYAGPLGHHSQKLVQYFQAIPGVPKMEEGINPATWMLDISSSAAEARLGVDFAEVYEKSSLAKRTKELVKALSVPREDAQDLKFATQYSQPFYVQLKACLWKQFWTYWRSPGYNLVRFFFTFVAALLFGSIFWQRGRKIDTQLDLINVLAIVYGATMFLGINNSSTVQPVVSVERSVFYRERGAGLYSPLAYALAQVLIEFPFVLFQSSYYCAITYSMVGYFWNPAKFFWYLYFSFCSFLYFTFYGMMAVAITPNLQLAAIAASSFYAIFNLFSGFVIPRTRIPGWWIWYYWICPVEWTVTGLLTSQYADLEQNVQLANGDMQPVKAWLKDYFGYRKSFLPVVAVVIILFPLLFASVFVVATKRLNFQRR